MVNYRLKALIMDVVENQLKMDDPKCTKVTLMRLKSLGYSEQMSKEMIGSVVIEEMYHILKEETHFNEKKYCEKLSLLPDYYFEKKG